MTGAPNGGSQPIRVRASALSATGGPTRRASVVQRATATAREQSGIARRRRRRHRGARRDRVRRARGLRAPRPRGRGRGQPPDRRGPDRCSAARCRSTRAAACSRAAIRSARPACSRSSSSSTQLRGRAGERQVDPTPAARPRPERRRLRRGRQRGRRDHDPRTAPVAAVEAATAGTTTRKHLMDPKARLCHLLCPPAPSNGAVEPKRRGIIIRVSAVRVPPPA